MDRETVIRVGHVDKIYKLYAYPKDRMKEALHPLRRKYHKEFYALQDVSFEVRRGETVGIIGLNGSGKSTLLKVICGVLTPNRGEVSVAGRVSALLELGAGFNPDFTGMENVYFQGAIMGYTRREMEALVPQILEFADIGDFVHQQVKTYSSGMFVRLAFAIAISVDPDVLIVDEALAVGDAYFQAKCMKRIRQFKEQGKTILFVSHDPSSVQALCDMAYLLDKGKVIEHGAPDMVFDVYNAMLSVPDDDAPDTVRKTEHAETGKIQITSGTGEATVRDIRLENSRGARVEQIAVGEAVKLCVEVEVNADLPELVLGYMIKNRLGQPMYGTNTWHTGQVLKDVRAGESYRFEISFQANLGEGDYSVTTALTEDETHLSRNYEWADLKLIFRVFNSKVIPFVGSCWIQPEITVEKITS